MKINRILSTRGYNDKVYSDLIYEWEDDYANALHVPIKSHSNKIEHIYAGFRFLGNKLHILDILQKFNGIVSSNSKKLVFTLYPNDTFNYRNCSSNTIPFIIDFDYGVCLERFYKTYKNCRVVIISSRVAYEYLKANNCPLNIKHVPLSIKSNLNVNRVDIKDRKYDIFIARQNPVLMEYLKRYEEKHPEVHYIVRKWEDNKLYSCNAYYSNKEGRLGEYSDRSAYLGLLCNSKVAFYSTAGSDMQNTRFMNHVTPALLEYITAGCQVMIRWCDTPDSDFFGLKENFKNATSYEVFEELLNKYLSNVDNNFDKCDSYLEKYGFASQLRVFKNQLGL